MLEILLVVYLCKQIGKIAEAKGRSVAAYRTLLVALWIVGEFGGMVAGATVSDGGGAIYLCALLGAAAGAIVSFVLANAASSKVTIEQTGPRGFAVGPAAPPRGEYR